MFIVKHKFVLESRLLRKVVFKVLEDTMEVFSRVGLLQHIFAWSIVGACNLVLGSGLVGQVATIRLGDDSASLFRDTHLGTVFEIASLDPGGNVKIGVDQRDIRNVDGVLLLQSLLPCDHFIVLHGLELQIDALNDNLVFSADHLQYLALTLLVTSRDNFNLIE